jgi:hypothetical protein
MKTQDVVVYHGNSQRPEKIRSRSGIGTYSSKSSLNLVKHEIQRPFAFFPSYHLSIVRTVSRGDSPVVPQGISKLKSTPNMEEKVFVTEGLLPNDLAHLVLFHKNADAPHGTIKA